MSVCPDGFDPQNWKEPAHARWAFRNVDRFLPTRRVETSAAAAPLSTSNLVLPDFPIGAEQRSWSDYRTAVSATSVLIVSGGNLVSEWYDDGEREARHTLFSITKSVVGLATLLLEECGALSIDDAVEKHAPELARSPFAQARIGDLLTMRDGVPFDENYSDAAAAIHRYSRYYWGGGSGGVVKALQSLEPGEISRGRFAYRTPVADVIGRVLRGASGEALTALLSRLIWRPIGAEAAALMICDTAGGEIAGTGLTARPRDLAKLAIALLSEVSPFSKSVRSRLFAGGDPAAVATAGYKTRSGWSYANLCWSPAPGQIAAMGVHGQKLFIDRESQSALIVTAAVPSPDVCHLDDWHGAAFAAVRRL